MALLTRPRSPSGECADGDLRDVGVLPQPRPQPGALLRVLSATFRAQAQKCRHALQIPPEKLHLQVPCPGARGAKPQLCTFSCGGKKGGLGWGALSASGPALEDSLLPTRVSLAVSLHGSLADGPASASQTFSSSGPPSALQPLPHPPPAMWILDRWTFFSHVWFFCLSR